MPDCIGKSDEDGFWNSFKEDLKKFLKPDRAKPHQHFSAEIYCTIRCGARGHVDLILKCNGPRDQLYLQKITN